jgi:hypothetical protein
MRTRTLAELRTDVRNRADMVNDAHVTDAMLTTWLNQGIAELWDILLYADPDRCFRQIDVSTTAGVSTYELPEDFYQIRGLDLIIQGRQIPVEPFTFQERVGPTAGTLVGYYGAPSTRYMVRFSDDVATPALALVFDPDPGTQTYRLYYIFTPTLLSADGDTFDGVAGWEDYAVEYARKCALERQEQDSSPAAFAMAALKARIEKMATLKDASYQPTIADVRGTSLPSRRRFYR